MLTQLKCFVRTKFPWLGLGYPVEMFCKDKVPMIRIRRLEALVDDWECSKPLVERWSFKGMICVLVKHANFIPSQ
jgi:hypothetical protein